MYTYVYIHIDIYTLHLLIIKQVLEKDKTLKLYINKRSNINCHQ